MERYERHFVSQRIGRAIGAVNFDGAGLGVVEITATGAPLRMSFAFTLLDLPDEQEATVALAELLLRTAISQIHKEISKPMAQTGPGERRLSAVYAPWIGDLEMAPYGGATAGFALHGARKNT
ncbi:hypothetical protein F2P44_22790 [Massilia sp. CCM 8695]|uniref:Uncharacterized protein n=1 Tax=Massilia frigida TaxID=2609281 RepID=A0ABX0N9H5_9BURK|nr:hypothetical protein [Massilia frigida]NHZ82082.1 hypothetical protein [Massilia frigida]